MKRVCLPYIVSITILLSILSSCNSSVVSNPVAVTKYRELTENAPLAFKKITPSHLLLHKYELFTLSIDISATFDNPFDPEQIEVIGEFKSQSGKTISIPGFYYRDFTLDQNMEISEYGRINWLIRFVPCIAGKYEYSVSVKNKETEIVSDPASFEATGSNLDGFIRVSKNNARYMEFDSGKPYFAIGEGVAWVNSNRKLEEYEYYFKKLYESGCNYSRIWMCEWNLALEWKNYTNTQGRTYGLGKYSLDNSFLIDQILDLAKKYGLHLLLTLDTYGSLMSSQGMWGEEAWKVNPYNSVNGGPCNTAEDYWTNAEARRLYKQRLRYIVSRWGYSPHVLAFELWNEVNAPPEWIREMAGYIKSIDSNRHMVTNSIGFPWGEAYREAELWKLEEIDYTQIHLYGWLGDIKDIATAVAPKAWEMAQKYKKPFIFGEYGLDSSKDDIEYDVNGAATHLHQGIWAAMMSGSFGIPITHWKEYVDKKNLYGEFIAASRFASGIEWTDKDWKQVKISNLKTITQGSGDLADVVLQCSRAWGEKCSAEIRVQPDGTIEGTLNGYLHGKYQQGKLKVAPTIYVNFIADGKLGISLNSVSKYAQLVVSIDGKQVWSHSFIPGPGKGEWESSTYDERYGIYNATYNKDYEIPIPKGQHTITLDNKGDDWALLNNYTLKGYKKKTAPDISIIGLSTSERAILWVLNKNYTWDKVYKQIEVKKEPTSVFEVYGLRDGQYAVETWDTYTGTIIEVAKKESKNKILTIELPELLTDFAYKIHPY